MVKLNLKINPEFFKPETRCNYYISTKMKEVWAVNLDLLSMFISVCKKYDLKYYVAYGTLLGTVRHKGFIPWDDDIDIVMDRKNYDKLCEIAPSAFQHPYFFQNDMTDYGFTRAFSRLRNSETTAIQDYEKDANVPYNQGLWIDIFPVDNLPNELEKRKEFASEISNYHDKMWEHSYKTIRFDDSVKSYKTSTNKFKWILKYVSKKLYLRLKLKNPYRTLIEEKSRKYNNEATDYFGVVYAYNHEEKNVFFKSDFDDTVEMPFEMLKVSVPIGYVRILNRMYGDWTVLKQGENTHGKVWFDTSISYKENINKKETQKEYKMKKFGIVSYNIYCNFTNYGSALQSWALHNAINKLGNGKWKSVLVDYCPDILKNKDPLNPIEHMWDTDATSRKMCELSLPAIRENYKKFEDFYNYKFDKTKENYDSSNFDTIIANEQLDGFVCGSDTIFCIDEFGFDDGYYANYSSMKNGYSVAYAASFGDPHFNSETYEILNKRLSNFKAIALRENMMVSYVREHTDIPVQKVIDPTLLLTSQDYDVIAEERIENEKYLLLYARRYDPNMESYAEKIASENGWKIIEISLRATNAEKHTMMYEAGVEEFLALVKHAEFVITNSYHGMIFSVQYRRPFYIFSREQCDSKITELLELMGLSERMLTKGISDYNSKIDYDSVHNIIESERKKSLQFLQIELENCK